MNIGDTRKIYSTKDLPKRVVKQLENKQKIIHDTSIDTMSKEIVDRLFNGEDNSPEQGLINLYATVIDKSKTWEMKIIDPEELLIKSKEELIFVRQFRDMLKMYTSAAAKKALLDTDKLLKKRIKDGINFAK